MEATKRTAASYTHMVVSMNGWIGYMTGNLQECRIWQLASGLRATTKIVEW